MCSPSGHVRRRWVCFFISVSSMDALQWMGAVRMRVQTADKNITIIHITPVHQLTSEDKRWNKSIIKTFLTLNHCFWLKYESIIHNNTSSVIRWSGLNQERNLHRSSTVYKPKQSKTALNKYVAGFSCERQQEIDFFAGGSVIMDYGLVF